MDSQEGERAEWDMRMLCVVDMAASVCVFDMILFVMFEAPPFLCYTKDHHFAHPFLGYKRVGDREEQLHTASTNVLSARGVFMCCWRWHMCLEVYTSTLVRGCAISFWWRKFNNRQCCLYDTTCKHVRVYCVLVCHGASQQRCYVFDDMYEYTRETMDCTLIPVLRGIKT